MDEWSDELTTSALNVTWQKTSISKQDRRKKNGHASFAIWLTGLSGAGKSTLANALEVALHELGIHTYLLDGDNLRMGINANLGFSEENRKENVRRVSEVAKLFVDAGIVVIAAIISPIQRDREDAKRRFGQNEFFEVFVDCPIDVCQKRDPKGLYQKARNGQISNFTGLHSPYEAPSNPDIVVRTDRLSIEEGAAKVISFLKSRHLLS